MPTRFAVLLLTFGAVLLLTFMLPGSVGGQSGEITPEPVPAFIDDPEPLWDGTLRRIRVPILMYHYVSPLPEGADQYRTGLTVSPQQFQAQMDYLFYQGYSTISLYQLNDALLTGTTL